MNDKFLFWHCMIFSLIIGCTNNKHQKIINANYSDSNHLEATQPDMTEIHKVENDSLSNYDLYMLINDTLVQEVYINYLTPRQIKFLVRARNTVSSHECEYVGTARLANGEGTAQGSDELNNDELYGVYEYFTNGVPFLQ